MSWINSYNLEDDTFMGNGESKIFYRTYQPKEGKKETGSSWYNTG